MLIERTAASERMAFMVFMSGLVGEEGAWNGRSRFFEINLRCTIPTGQK